MRRIPKPLRPCLLTLPLLTAGAVPGGDAPASFRLSPATISATGRVEVGRPEGFSSGLLRIRGDDARAELRGTRFRNGTIEFDMRAIGDGMPGVAFRRRGGSEAELIYVRTQRNCPAETDCIQYVPIVHGVMPWNMYPQYQNRAPIDPASWNHYRVVVSGRRMRLYVGDHPKPILVVGGLEGGAAVGGVGFQGPAEFANIRVAAGGPDLPASADPSFREGRYLRDWLVSPWRPAPLDPTPSRPAGPSSNWRFVKAERFGVVNLSRLYGSPTDQRIGAMAWLRTTIRSKAAGTIRADMGFLSEADVFVNGRKVFSGRNLYYPATGRRTPDGRLCVTNARFAMPLRAGSNDVAIAVNNILGVGHRHYGWGVSLRVGGRRDGRPDDDCEMPSPR